MTAESGGRTGTTWTNWAGNQRCAPRSVVRPTHTDEIADIVARSAAAGARIRVLGAGHSFSPLVVTDDTLLDMSAVAGLVGVDAATATATVRAGTTIAALADALWDTGFSLRNQGDIDSQQVGGAIGTATHGSGLGHRGFSGVVTGARLVTADGTARWFDAADPALPAIQVSLGTLGVITDVRLAVAPAYQLAEWIEYWPFERAAAEFAAASEAHRHFSFFWGPTPSSLALYGLADGDVDLVDACYVKIYDELPPDATEADAPTARRVDRAHRIYPQVFEKNFHELEYYVPWEFGIAAIGVVRRLMLDRHPDQRIPVEVRSIAAEPGYLSPMYGGAAVSISVSGAPNTDYWPFLRDVDAALRDFAPRAHWGKIHFLDRAAVAARYPRHADFVATRRGLDPRGVFLNEHTAELVE